MPSCNKEGLVFLLPIYRRVQISPTTERPENYEQQLHGCRLVPRRYLIYRFGLLQRESGLNRLERAVSYGKRRKNIDAIFPFTLPTTPRAP